MRPWFRPASAAWLLALLCAAGFLVGVDRERVRRVRFVTNTDAAEMAEDATSPTGYAAGKRWLIVPEHNNRSYQWIAETQQMFAQREWRVRQVNYENAPLGRAVHSASLYRWWLGLVAWVEHASTGRPLALAVENAALWADPLLHLALLLATTVFVARQFGGFAAALIAVGLVTIYPFAGGFVPGAPEERGLARALALWSVLPLAAAFLGATVTRAQDDDANAKHARARRNFFLAGIAGGAGLWISAAQQTPVLIGIAIGGFIAAGLGCGKRRARPEDQPPLAPWRFWAIGGAATSLAAYFVEYFPAHLGFQLEVNHPCYAVAWLGAGELLTRAGAWSRRGNPFWNWRQLLAVAIASVAVASLPLAMAWRGTESLLGLDSFAARLSFLPNGVLASSFREWIARDGLTAALQATILPLLFLFPALWLLASRRASSGERAALALVLAPVGVALALSFNRIAWWSTCDALLLALVVVSLSRSRPLTARRAWLWTGGAALVLAPGLVQLLPPPGPGEKFAFTRLEVEGLLERTLAHWIADHAGADGAVILVPPDRTASLCFHGGLRGIATDNWENREGLAATVRIVTAATADEAQALLNARGVTHLILPSWDSALDAFARWTLRNPEDAFIMALHHWAVPVWLRPLPYKLPVVPGFEDQSVVILQVTTETNRVTSLARLAEYAVESQRPDLAAAAAAALQRYPADLNALIALAHVAKAGGDADGFASALNTLLASLDGGFDRGLAWDRRVSLAVVLTLGERNDLAREQLQRCFEKLDAARIRSLTTGSLFRLLVLGKAFATPIADPELNALARQLLPAELRARL